MLAPVTAPDTEITADRPRTVLKVVGRVAVVVVALVIAGFVLVNIFDDLDPAAIRDALQELSDAEWLALFFGWLIWVGCQGLQTASLVHGMPARRGVLASLGPTAVSSVFPGPSDLPVRYAMYQSWGISNNEAGTAVASSGIFSIGSQLALPAIAGVLIFFGDIQLDGFLSIIIAATLVLAVAIVVVGFTLGSADRTARAAERLERPYRAVLHLFRRPEPERPLADTVLEQRAMSVAHLSDKWLGTTAATIVTVAAKCSLLVMTLRFVGIPEDALGWTAIFAVYALVAGITTLPISPGSAGVAEVAYIGMLTPIAGDAYVNEVAAGVLLFRLMTWILIIPAGLGALGVWKYGLRAEARAAEAA